MTRAGIAAVLLLTAAFAQGAERVVTIESARTSEYIKSDSNTITGTKIDDGGESAAGPRPPLTVVPAVTEIVRFSGNVVIVVTEGSSVSRISADEIVYDKNRDTLEARGSVRYEHKSGGTSSEKFSGEALLFNIKKQEGVFLEGVVVQDPGNKSSDKDPTIIHAEVTGRDSSTTMAFKKGVLTTCDEEDPHWSINASRIWLLPGNEIAILNGIFFIGPLPLFYIPFFYYPSDEMIVHPVFGFRNREGYFVQTTSYFIGRKPLPSKSGTGLGSSFSNFLQGDTMKEQKRNGLFLQNLEADAKSAGPDYFKLMADAYSSLGAMVGLDGSFTPDGYIKKIQVAGILGFSRTLYPPSEAKKLLYSTYDKGGTEHYNSGWFYGTELPFRFRANFSMQMDKKPFQISVAVPLISDPYFKSDFLTRTEDLNWFKYLTDQDKLAKGTPVSEESSYSWNVNGSIRPDISFFNPWISTFSVSSLSGLLTFNSKQNASISGEELLYSPEKKFFYPEIIKPQIAVTLGGTLLTSQKSVKKSGDAARRTIDVSPVIDPFKDSAAPAQGDKNEEVDRFVPPAGIALAAAPAPGAAAYSVTWNMDPSALQEIRYDSTEWKAPGDIDWNSYSSLYYKLQNTIKLQGNYSWDSDFFSANSSLAYTGAKHEHPWLSDTAAEYKDQSRRDTIKINDYKASVYTVTTSDSVQLRPFNRNPVFKPVFLGWNLAANLVKTEFDGTVDKPSWKTKTVDWDKEYITAHTATANAGVALSRYEQKFALTSNLDPLLEAYSGSANFAWPYGTLGMGTRLYEKEKAEKKWFWDPFTATQGWNFPIGISLTQTYVYDLEDETPTSYSLTGNWGFFSADYRLNRTVPYKLVTGTGWVLDGTDKKFIPTSAGFSFNNGSKPIKIYQWKNRISLNTNFSSKLIFNLLKPTDSSLDFSPYLSFNIHQFLQVTFTAYSRNDVMARYFQDWIDLPAPLPGETDILTDLAKSFNFSNTRDRTDSGFKLKSLKMTMTHYLHDWTSNLDIEVKPELKTDSSVYRYDFIPTVTFMVQWKPISDIKTTVKSEKSVFSLNTTESTPAK